MALLILSIVIALTMVFLGMFIMQKTEKNLNMDQLLVFIAIASGFMLAALFIDLLPENMIKYSVNNGASGLRVFFAWSLLGMALVVAFERYGVPRLKFVERFFHVDQEALKHIQTHDEHLHNEHDGQGGHHHHQNLDQAEHCEHSHEHGHVHRHTHMDVLGHGEVCSAIACFMICSFFDGIAISSVQAVDPKMGFILIVGVVLHLLPEGILSGTMALAGGASLSAAKKVLFFIGGAFVLGSLIPFFITGFESIFLAVSSGILIFVTLVQLLPTALKLNFAPLWIGCGAILFIALHALMSWMGIGI